MIAILYSVLRSLRSSAKVHFLLQYSTITIFLYIGFPVYATLDLDFVVSVA